MKFVHSISELRTAVKQCDRILVLVNGSVESTHLCHLLTQHHRNITMLAVDFGTLNRHKLSEIACYFPVSLDIADGRERLQTLAIAPALRALAFGTDGVPFHSELLKMTLADMAVSYAKKNCCEGIFYAEYDGAVHCSDLDRAIEALGFDGYCGSPGQADAQGYLYRKGVLSSLGLRLHDQPYLEHSSSFWGRYYEIPRLLDSEDFRVPSVIMNQLRYARYRHSENFSLTFSEGMVTHLNLQRMPLYVICEHINDVAAPSLVGCFSGQQYWKAGRDHLQILHAPAAAVITRALQMLQEQVLTKSQLKEKAGMEKAWRVNLAQGAWFGQARVTAQRLLDQYSPLLNGTVHLTVRAGHIESLGVSVNKATLQAVPSRVAAS